MIVYFTATGNSRYCAQLLAELLGDECIDSFHFIRDHIAAELTSEKPWVFVAPTYSWQLPHVFMEFIRQSSFSGNKNAYFVMTCGNDIGKGFSQNEKLCQEKGFCCQGTWPVVMPENYIAMFTPPGPKEALEIIEAAGPVVDQCAAWIQQGQPFPTRKASLLDGLKSGIVNHLFYRFQIQAKPFRVSGACVSCGKCEKLCPLGNIQLVEGKPVWGQDCTHCMACICGCPVNAIEYGKASRGKPRYQCPKG